MFKKLQRHFNDDITSDTEELSVDDVLEESRAGSLPVSVETFMDDPIEPWQELNLRHQTIPPDHPLTDYLASNHDL